jgi:hypothetical protein
MPPGQQKIESKPEFCLFMGFLNREGIKIRVRLKPWLLPERNILRTFTPKK